MESIDKYLPSHPLLKQMVAAFVFWRRSSDEKSVKLFLPNNISGFGFTLSGELYAKKDVEFKKMPAFGTRNLFNGSSEIKTKGDFLNISVRFFIPNGIGLFTKMPMNMVYEHDSFSLDDIFQNQEIKEVAEKLSEVNTDTQRVEVLESFLLSKIINTNPPLLVEIIKFIHHSNGLFNVAYLAKQFSTSERTINRYFNRYIGINPIVYINLIRFRSVINSTTNTNTSFLANALDTGYYDQSHFIKHFKEFSKVTPTQFFNLTQKKGLSDFYNL